MRLVGRSESGCRHHHPGLCALGGTTHGWIPGSLIDLDDGGDVSSIRCPILAVQGYDDEYGSMAQLDAIARAVPATELLQLRGCGHVPYRDAPDVVTQATVDFIRRHCSG